MAKATPDAILDAMADAIIAAATTLYVCSDQPENFAGISSVALADVAIDSDDFTKANGDSSGRKVTIGQQADIEIDATGEADHIAIASADTLLYVTTCTAQMLTDGGTVTVPSWKIEVADPS